MAKAGFYIENEKRDYPFKTRVTPLSANGIANPYQLNVLPQEAIVDFGAIMDLEAGYSEEDGHYVYLHSINRFLDRLYFDFRTTAPAGSDHRLVFVRHFLTEPEFTGEWIESSLIETSATSAPSHSSSEPGCSVPKWRGFLITGTYTSLLTSIVDFETRYFHPELWQVEPARIQSLLGGHLQSLNLGNLTRQHALVHIDCGPPTEDPTIIHNNRECIQGHIRFEEGFNCTIAQDDQNNRLVIGAAVAAGAGQQCEEIPLFPSEVPPTGSPFLTGGPSCRQILKTINGKGGRNLQLSAGKGFQIYVDPLNDNTLVIDRNLHDFATCLVPVDSSLSGSSE